MIFKPKKYILYRCEMVLSPIIQSSGIYQKQPAKGFSAIPPEAAFTKSIPQRLFSNFTFPPLALNEIAFGNISPFPHWPKMKLRLVLNILLASFVLITSTYGQWRIPADSVYQLIKTNSIYKNTASWESIDLQFTTCMQTIKGNPDIINCYLKVFENSVDHQSSIVFKNKEYSTDPKNQNATASTQTIASEHSEKIKIKTSLFKENYAYIQITGNSKIFDNNKTAQSIADSINQYKDKTIKGFVVDLRLTNAGHFPSILSGLHSLLGNGVIGYDIDANGEKAKEWLLRDGNFMDHRCQITTINNTSDKFVKTPVVVLIGSNTRNAGSLTAIAFKNRPKTTLIGEATISGYTTSTIAHQISKEFTLHLAESYAADRKGRIYPRFVPPDLNMAGQDNFEDLQKDKKINAAIRWLEKQK